MSEYDFLLLSLTTTMKRDNYRCLGFSGLPLTSWGQACSARSHNASPHENHYWAAARPTTLCRGLFHHSLSHLASSSEQSSADRSSFSVTHEIGPVLENKTDSLLIILEIILLANLIIVANGRKSVSRNVLGKFTRNHLCSDLPQLGGRGQLMGASNLAGMNLVMET